MAAPSNGSSWQVTSQREDYQVGPNGQLSAGVVVTFETSSGISGSVFVPNASYTPDKVRALVADRVAAMEAVHRLAG